MTHGWTERSGLDLFDQARKLAPYCSEFLFTQVEREGMLAGSDLENALRLRVVTIGLAVLVGIRLVELGFEVFALTLDNGFISDGAKENIRRVTGELGVPVELATTPAMNAIFRDSLMRFSNVCNGCFKTIYNLALNLAVERGIPVLALFRPDAGRRLSAMISGNPAVTVAEWTAAGEAAGVIESFLQAID